MNLKTLRPTLHAFDLRRSTSAHRMTLPTMTRRLYLKDSPQSQTITDQRRVITIEVTRSVWHALSVGRAVTPRRDKQPWGLSFDF